MQKVKLSPKDLIIIGNGNELAYDIRTSYNDFKIWIEGKLKINLEELVNDVNGSVKNFLSVQSSKYSRKQMAEKSEHYKKLMNYKSIENNSLILETIAMVLWNVGNYYGVKNAERFQGVEGVDFEIFDNLLFKKYSKDYILLYFYTVFVNISKEKSLEDTTNINWGDIELQLMDLFEITASSTSENMELNRQFILNNFKEFKKIFTTFVNSAFSNYKENHLDYLRKSMKNAYANASKPENEFAILDFNYYSRYNAFKYLTNYVFVHGSCEDSEKIVFGANFFSTEYDELRYLLDKKHQVLLYNISKDKIIDYSNIENIYTFGFGFSKNDEYFIHGLLAHNTKVQFNIIQYGDEEKYSSDQLNNLYEIIGGYEHDRSLLSRKVVCNQIKILRSADFIDAFYNEL